MCPNYKIQKREMLFVIHFRTWSLMKARNSSKDKSILQMFVDDIGLKKAKHTDLFDDISAVAKILEKKNGLCEKILIEESPVQLKQEKI